MSNIRLLTVFITYILLCNHSSGQNNTPQLHTNSIDEVISAMSPEEKVYMVIGNNNNVWRKVQGVGSTWQCERLGITPAILDDGPAGLRIPPQRDGDSHTPTIVQPFLLPQLWRQHGIRSWLKKLD